MPDEPAGNQGRNDEHVSFGAVDSGGRRAIDDLLQEAGIRSARHVDNAGSTNTLALHDLRSGQVAADQLPRLYLADRQTSGRGRHGRTWHSNDGVLTFSLTVPWDLHQGDRAALISIAVGVGVARAIEFEFAPTKTRLKWPNDVYLDGGKVAGILIETSGGASDCVVIGIGVNVDRVPDASDTGPMTPQAISQIVGRPIGRYAFLPTLVTEVIAAIGELQNDVSDVLADFRKRCWLTGNEITFVESAQNRRGHCQGITDDGKLSVRCADGERYLDSGEANVVRRE